MYRRVQAYMLEKNPTLLIDGELHSPGTEKELIAMVGTVIWNIGLVLLFFGSSVFSMIGMNQPKWFQWCKQNQLPVALGLFMLNNIAQGLMKTGAFEIYLNGELVHSKIETGAFPTQETLDNLLATIASSSTKGMETMASQ